jgi:squalene cyclase
MHVGATWLRSCVRLKKVALSSKRVRFSIGRWNFSRDTSLVSGVECTKVKVCQYSLDR